MEKTKTEMMSRKKWFLTVLLPSLDAKIGEGAGECWVSEKQADILRMYMEPSKYWDFSYIIVGDWQYNFKVFKKGYGKLTKEDKRIAFH